MQQVYLSTSHPEEGNIFEVIEMLVKEGEPVEAGQPLLTVESPSRATEILAPGSGAIREIFVSIGEKIARGANLLTLSMGAALLFREETPVHIPDIGDYDEVTVTEVLVDDRERSP